MPVDGNWLPIVGDEQPNEQWRCPETGVQLCIDKLEDTRRQYATLCPVAERFAGNTQRCARWQNVFASPKIGEASWLRSPYVTGSRRAMLPRAIIHRLARARLLRSAGSR